MVVGAARVLLVLSTLVQLFPSSSSSSLFCSLRLCVSSSYSPGRIGDRPARSAVGSGQWASGEKGEAAVGDKADGGRSLVVGVFQPFVPLAWPRAGICALVSRTN